MDPAALEEARARRWWRSRRRIGSIERAAEFIDDVGFALLFPKTGVALPSLWEAASDRPIQELGQEWGQDAERIWGWKDELPLRGLAWYGSFVRGRKSFLSHGLLIDLYPWPGRPEDVQEADLGPDAARIARVLLRSGPQSTAVLREATNMEGKAGGDRFSKAAGELGRKLLVTHLGTQEEGAGWPAAVLELTARAFRIPRRRDFEMARLRATGAFLDTMVRVRPYELGNAFGWGADAARVCLEELVSGGQAVADGNGFLARP